MTSQSLSTQACDDESHELESGPWLEKSNKVPLDIKYNYAVEQ